MLLDLWAWRRNSVSPPAGGGGGARAIRGPVRAVQTDPEMAAAMLHSRIVQEDEELVTLIMAFARTLQ